ncbi:MAG: sigma-70 family RNA polymerase sigma factor, partial [Sediminibacterium sp.]|nr:sigma-70 family RNA polymerase sigma factor [Sediminibacterium sp.]
MHLPDQDIPTFRKTVRFERIYQATYFRLMYFITRMTRNEIAREDLLQETYVHLWINLEKITDDEKIFPLLRMYATNIIINFLKKSAREQFRAEQFYKRLEPVTTQEEVMEIKECIERYEHIL